MDSIMLYDTIGRTNKRQHISTDATDTLCGWMVDRKSGVMPSPFIPLSDLQHMICKHCWKAHQKASKP